VNTSTAIVHVHRKTHDDGAQRLDEDLEEGLLEPVELRRDLEAGLHGIKALCLGSMAISRSVRKRMEEQRWLEGLRRESRTPVPGSRDLLG